MKAKFAPFLLLPVLITLASAQTTPSLLSYQGRVSDASGVLIGNTAPVNRTVTFRVYTAASGGTAVYAETQTVTISGGEFSVLIGNGTGVSGSPGPSSPATTPYKTLGDIINGTPGSLYLGITVDDGTSAADPEISPRQQLVSGAYALRAKVAESVASGSVTSAMIGDSQVNTNQITANAITSAKIADLSIVAADIAANTITAGKLDTTTIGLWTPTGNNVWRPGNVGIGESNPGFPLNFASTLGEKISLWGTSGNHLGFGIQANQLQIFGANSNDDIVFGYGNSTTMSETMRVRGSGNVGIGTSNPINKLHVENGGVLVRANNAAVSVSNADGSAFLDAGIASNNGAYSTSATTKDGVLRANGGRLLLQSGVGAAGLAVNTANNVGIGTVDPVSKFHISEPTGTVAGVGGGTITLDHENTGGVSSIVFRSKGNRTSDYAYIQYQDDATVGGAGETSRLVISTQNDADDNVILAPTGRVGIGTMTPAAPLHVAGGASITLYQQSYLDANGAHDSNNQNHSDTYSIYSENRVAASAYDSFSDRRIKTGLKPTDGAADLATLEHIEVTDYRYKDSVREGNRPQKKVIAQQVESVFPQAVSSGRGVVPDIYQKAAVKDGWVALATDLKVGEKVRLIGGNQDSLKEVLEVREGAFRTSFSPESGELFVYGREVPDFRTVDYDAISMLNVSATQQIKKEKDEEINQLKSRVSDLEARLNALEKLSASK